MNRLFKKIRSFIFSKSNSVLRDVFSRLEPLRALNAKSFEHSRNKTIDSYFASLWYKKNYDLNDIKHLKYNNTKTLFLLGSGPSINEINEDNWKLIKENESWGFNLWHIHNFIPNFYIAQQAGDDTYLHSRIMEKVLREKKEEYKDVTFILRGTIFNELKLHKYSFGKFLLSTFKNIYPLPEYVISSTCSIEPETYLRILNQQGFFNAENYNYPVPKFGATIGLLLSFALKLGYKKIVLCGIDMLNNNHFYDDKKYSADYKDLQELSKKESASVNPNNNRDKRAYTDLDYIIAFKKFLNERGGDIYVSSKNSILYPHLEIFPDFTK